ncbi:TonB-dependent receptor plug domain-containing protein, partial [Escherichia coli]|nr:TonB-dependent receptor plug domain-containing protein [Escherichia coli]
DIEDVKEYPGARTVITRDQIEKTAAGSIDNALQRVPGIKVQDESGTGVLPNISVRGLKASRSGHAQFLMDGVPLTLAPYGHTGQSIFPATLSMLDRIDIVRGGAAVQYG